MPIELMCGTTVLCVQNNDSVQNEGSSSLHIIGYEQCAFNMFNIFVDYTNHVVSDILMEECDAVFNGPAEHIQLTQKHFSIYEQWPVKCCGVHS